ASAVARRRGLAAVPGRADAAALRGEAGCGTFPVPAMVRDLAEEQGLRRGVRRAAAGLPGRRGVPPQDLDGGTQPGGDAGVPDEQLLSELRREERPAAGHVAGMR